MITKSITKDAFITEMAVKLNTSYTDEQRAMIESFGEGPTFCFADPGTGKTYTAVGGLIYAELYKQIPGKSIYAMSFTNLATGELMVRHTRACQALGCTESVNFSTLHSLCSNILRENYAKLGMVTYNKPSNLTIEQNYDVVAGTCQEWGIAIEPKQIKQVIYACKSLNSALIFDEDNVKSKLEFKKCKVDYETFDKIRGLLFSYSILSESVNVSDIMLYTLMLMTKYPEISAEFKQKCKLMLIDEAQDLSLLHLRIISMLTANPVFIGDMKQQIYAFNGACQEIVQAFFKLYPKAITLKLTQSFRCKNEIAEYATKIILHNNTGGEDFTGTGQGGMVHICAAYDGTYSLRNIIFDIREKYIQNHNKFEESVLFLFRNNTSALPIVEELFQQGLPFMVNNYSPAYMIPVVKGMCELLMLCQSPYSVDRISALSYIIPEFRAYQSNIRQHPYYQIMRKTGCSFYEVNYQFKEPMLASDAMELMRRLKVMCDSGAQMSDLCNTMWQMYYNQWVIQNEWHLEAKPEYYINSVAPLMHKTFAQFIQDESKKIDINNKSKQRNHGVRCYTMHGSKGLEADIVYIIDADEGLVPNVKKLDDMVRKSCEVDAARAVREERSLCYVACTRAKRELYIVYTNQPSAMLLGNNQYEELDAVYNFYRVPGDDISAFNSFVERYITL